MISEDLRLELKKFLGARFSKDVNKNLESKGLKTYSPGFISQVLNGESDNLDVEQALLFIANERKEAIQSLENSKSAFIKKIPKAVTSGT
jgi:hypothetical protein